MKEDKEHQNYAAADRAGSLREQLQDLGRLIAGAQDYGTPDFVSQIVLDGMLAERAELQAELKQALRAREGDGLPSANGLNDEESNARS